MNNEKVDNYVIEFCKEALEVLRYNDNKIRENMRNSIDCDFYEYLNKGITVTSITEPILKFLIFSALCKNYRIWPEVGEFYKDRKYLDLALYSPIIDESIVDENGLVVPDVAIEMKWGGIKKTGEFYVWSVKNLIEDVIKINKNCIIENKYLLQFLVLADCDIDESLIIKQVNETIDKRMFRNKKLNIIFCDYFDTYGNYLSINKKFYLILWKIVE